MNASTMILTLTMVAAALLASGCLEEKKIAEYHAYGTKGSYTAGFAYDGKGIVPFDGGVFIDVSDADNTGMVVAKGKIGAQNFDVNFSEFAPSKPFHDGGIAADFLEHGASGVGDKTIPQVDLEMAGWGKAQIRYGDQVYKDPISGLDKWTAHFMVIRNGVRDNATGGIYADANKTKPYDPLHPENGTSEPGDYEIHLVLRNQTGNASQPMTITASSSMTPNPTVSDSRMLFTSTLLGATATVDFTVSGTGVSASNMTFTIKAPSGQVVGVKQLGPAQVAPSMQPARGNITFKVQELGDYQLTATGRIAPGGGYSVGGTVVPPATFVLNLWWEDVTFGEEAETKAEAAGLLGDGMMDDHSHMSPTSSSGPQ